MSIQIQIVQSLSDETELAKFLGASGLTQFQPRIFPTGGFQPRTFADSCAQELVVFRKTESSLVRRCLKAVNGQIGLEVVRPISGATIEWTRTRWLCDSECVPGRLYWSESSGTHLTDVIAEAEVKSLMRKTVSFVRKRFPLRTDQRHPYYVGHDLARRVRENTISVVFENGRKLSFIQNGSSAA